MIDFKFRPQLLRIAKLAMDNKESQDQMQKDIKLQHKHKFEAKRRSHSYFPQLALEHPKN